MKAFSQILSEQPSRKVAVMAFGRMNPPTRGHSMVVQRVVDEAARRNADHFVFVSRRQDARENPLDIDTKMEYLRAFFPNANLVSEASTPWDAVLSLCAKGYRDIVLVTGDDGAGKYGRIAEYKGKVAQKDPLGRTYSFENFSVVVAGDPRDDSVVGVSSVRSSKARKAAWDGDFMSFADMVPSADGTIRERMYNDVRRGMGLTEHFVTEQKQDAVHVLCVTSAEGDVDGSTVEKIEKSCKRKGIPCDVVKVKFAHVDSMKANHSSIVLENIDGEGKKIDVDPANTVALVRGGVMNSEIGVGLMTVLQNHGVFMVNEKGGMDLCANKLQTALALQRNGLPHPRTAFVADEKSIPDAMRAIGGKYPVVVKTLTGAEGIGVSIIESEKSLTSVLQSLWKFGAEILLQEFIPGFKNDVRSLVLNGRIFASAKRDKAKGDFRTNIARGSKGGSIVLKPEEIELVERAARVSKCYFVGIDHVIVDGKPYIIEMNASPGSGNLYQMYDEEKKATKVVEGDRLIDALVEHISDKSRWKLFTSVAVTDEIRVGKHKTMAKIDTGNSGYNCIHATDIKIDEKNHTVSFNLLGKYPMKEQIQSRVKIRHAGSTDRSLRPVVFFDVEFAGKKFENIKFTLADRSHMRHPVLVGIRFLVQAGVQVDPSRMTADNGKDGSDDDDVVEVAEETARKVTERRKKAYRKAHSEKFGDTKPDVEESVIRFLEAGNPISEIPEMMRRMQERGEVELAEGYGLLMDVSKGLSYQEGAKVQESIDHEYEWLIHEMFGKTDIMEIVRNRNSLTEALQGDGDCMVAAANLVMNGEYNGKKIPKGAILVHALVRGQGELKGYRFAHAWAEKGDTVYDYSNGGKIVMERGIYYAIGGVKPNEKGAYVTYTNAEMSRMLFLRKHYGPWEIDHSLEVSPNAAKPPSETEKKLSKIRLKRAETRPAFEGVAPSGTDLVETSVPSLKKIGRKNISVPSDLISRLRSVTESSNGDAADSERDSLYKEWRRLVNMSAKEIQSFLDSEDGKKAGLSRKEAGSAGAGGKKITSGRDSARAIIRMLGIPKDTWTENDWKWAGKQVNFISRMKGVKGGLKDEKGRPSRKLLSLKVWGHNPEKASKG